MNSLENYNNLLRVSRNQIVVYRDLFIRLAAADRNYRKFKVLILCAESFRKQGIGPYNNQRDLIVMAFRAFKVFKETKRETLIYTDQVTQCLREVNQLERSDQNYRLYENVISINLALPSLVAMNQLKTDYEEANIVLHQLYCKMEDRIYEAGNEEAYDNNLEALSNEIEPFEDIFNDEGEMPRSLLPIPNTNNDFHNWIWIKIPIFHSIAHRIEKTISTIEFLSALNNQEEQLVSCRRDLSYYFRLVMEFQVLEDEIELRKKQLNSWSSWFWYCVGGSETRQTMANTKEFLHDVTKVYRAFQDVFLRLGVTFRVMPI